MKLALFTAVVMSLSFPAFGDEFSYRLSNPLDFAAPIVYSRANVTEAAAGTIVYDNNSQAFYGLTPGGNPSSASSWVSLGVPGGATPNVTSTSTGQEHIERVFFGGASSATVCSSSPCNISTNGFNATPGVSSVTRTGVGAYNINFTAGTFSQAPVCTPVAASASTGTCQGWSNNGLTSTLFPVYCTADVAVNVICMGPH